MKDIIEHINKVREQAIKQYIRANTIIIDKDVAMVNKLWFTLPPDNSIVETPIMLFGLKVEYEENLSDKLGVDCNFVITNRNTIKPKTPLSDYSTDELIDEIKRRLEVQDNE